MNRLPMIPQEQPRQDLPPEGGSHETEGLVADPVKTEALGPAIQAALKKVYDPEIPVDIYELGLIYKVDIEDDRSVKVEMTLTTPNCPSAAELPIGSRPCWSHVGWSSGASIAALHHCEN